MSTALGILVAGVLLLWGCGTNGTTAAPEESVMDSSTPPIGEPLAGLVEDAVADLATRLDVPANAIRTTRAQAVTWRDGSLGCPKPGQFYTQALVEGYQVTLEHHSRVYLYHAGGDGPVFLCASDEPDGGHEFVPPPGFYQ